MQPKNKEELKKIISEAIAKCGRFVDLNFIDVSQITDMSHLFEESNFNGDISRWDVSNVTNMERMFRKSKFNGNISNWDVSNVTNMEGLFASSAFAGDVSNWNVSNVTNMRSVFFMTPFKGDISRWDVSNVTNMRTMFYQAEFNGDISAWNVSNVENMEMIFEGSLFKGNIFNWDLKNIEDLAGVCKGAWSKSDAQLLLNLFLTKYGKIDPNQTQQGENKMKTIKLDESCLEGKYKILSAKAIEQIKDIIQSAEEETTVELPEGLLFLNLTEDEFEDIEANDNVVFKIPSTVIGFAKNSFMDCGNRIMLPSFMQETNIASSFGDEYYECDVPKRSFGFSGAAHVGQELWIQSVSDENEASEIYDKIEDDPYATLDNADTCFSFIDVADDASGPSWTLELEGLKLDLYTDDFENGVYFDVDESNKMMLIMQSSEINLENFLEDTQVVIKVKTVKHATREAMVDEFAGLRLPDPFASDIEKEFWDVWKDGFKNVAEEAIAAGYYVPTLLCRMGVQEIGSSVATSWGLTYYGRNVDWNNGGDEQGSSYYYFDGSEYKELPLEDPFA